MTVHLHYTHIFFILFLVGAVLDFALDLWLEGLDFAYRKKHGREIPPELTGQVDASTLDKTCRYEDAKYRLWLPRHVLGLVFALAFVFTGFYPRLFAVICELTQSTFLRAVLFLLLGALPEAVVYLPFRLYREFGIEKRFGFSTMTLRLWVLDWLKNLLVSAVLGLPLLAAMLFLLLHANSWWWLLLGGIYVAFSLLVSLIYPALIAPLFNKFTPLEDGELKTLLEKTLAQVGFTASGVFVMDASKRSKHSNAYFTGFGKSKRVVLYDTLLTQLTPQEIQAVLAHELGHYKHRHIIKRLCVVIPLIFAMLFAANCFIRQPALYTTFGFALAPEELNMAATTAVSADGTLAATYATQVVPQLQFIGIFLLSLVFGSYGTLFSPLANHFSRRHEFQADAFARATCGTGEPLCTALITLNKENLSELVPPKIYSVFNYSHPPLLERIRALRQ